MGHSPSKRHKVEAQVQSTKQQTITSRLTTGVPRICSHQQVDDHRKRETHTAEHTTTEG